MVEQTFLFFALAAVISPAKAFSSQNRLFSASGVMGVTQRNRFQLATASGMISETGTTNNINVEDAAVNKDFTSLGTLSVPSVGVGTISWSSDKLMRLESPEIESLVDAACSLNAAFFDTAERYGSNYKTAIGMGWGETESLVKMSLDRAKANTDCNPVVATKFTPSPWRTTAESVVEACEQSRRRLGVEQIDLYQLHMPDIVQPFKVFGKTAPKDDIYWEGLAECYNKGLVKNVGVCNYGPTLLMRCQDALAKRGVPLASNQIAYSLIGRHNGAEKTLQKCNELGIKISKQAMDSLLTNKKTKLEELDLMRYMKGDGVNIPLGGVTPLLTVMQEVANRRGKTVAQVALNYIICKGAIPIPGARTREQLLDNVGAMGWRLTDEELLLLEQTSDSLGIGFDGAGFKRTSEKFVGYGIEKWSLD